VDASVFFALWLQKPLRIAAVNPSGVRLADALARCVDLARSGPILELGAGTRSVTAGPRPRRLSARAHHRARARTGPRRGAAAPISGDEGNRRRRDANRRLSRRLRRTSRRRRLHPADQMVSDRGAICRRQALPRSSRTGRPLPPADERVLLAPRGDRLGIAGRQIGRVWLNLLPTQIWAYSERSEEVGDGASR
jgi:hypothetical protein